MFDRLAKRLPQRPASLRLAVCLAGLLVSTAGVLVIVAGCGGEHKEEESAQDRIDKLRSLPYIGFTNETVPADQVGTRYLDPAKSYPGYNLYTVRDLSRAELVDAKGELIQRWQGPPGRWARASLQSNGDVLIVGMDRTRYAMRMNWRGDLLWRFDLETHHDIGLTPDGRVMVLTFDTKMIPQVSNQIRVRDDRISILSNDGKVVESASLFDMMSAAGFQFLRIPPDPNEGYIDLFHANSMQWMTQEHLFDRNRIYEAGNIIVSIRHQNTVAVFDWDKKELLWEWGRGHISGQHDAQVLANGNFLIFDNGIGRDWSRVIELDPMTKRIVWEYSAPDKKMFYTLGRGANQRLPNGNTLITQSDSGRAFEVTHGGEIVWDYFSPYVRGQRRATFVRCYRYETEFIDRLLEQ
jgi:outer membrane protein assembly factor BamB